MTWAVPARPKIYHIVHLDRLPSIIADGGLLCDAEISRRPRPVGTTIGMSAIKMRRLTLPVHCYPRRYVADFVPLYFCPRSIMLYLIHCKNHPELSYHGGQDPILHLVADLYTVTDWANENEVPWAFSLSNAGSYYAQFRKENADLNQINWDAVQAADFRTRETKEGKQAEFLVHHTFPWELVEQVGAINKQVANAVALTCRGLSHRPSVTVQRNWYY